MIDGREERIRLIGIDTPETKRPDTDIECFGPEASAFTESLLPVGTPVRIERDTVNRDDYGRLLGYVYRADDGIFVNYELVRQGFAQPLSIEPNTDLPRALRRRQPSGGARRPRSVGHVCAVSNAPAMRDESERNSHVSSQTDVCRLRPGGSAGLPR